MGYNKAKEENSWKRWKEKEEHIMKNLGVDEIKIRNLHQFDSELFNSERRFLQRQYTNSRQLEYAVAEHKDEIDTLDKLLDELENEELYLMIKNMKKMDLMIIFLKLCGYKNKEIASYFQVSSSAISQRISKIQNRLKKFLD